MSEEAVISMISERARWMALSVDWMGIVIGMGVGRSLANSHCGVHKPNGR